MHSHFVNHGIEAAVESILMWEQPSHILAFSIGGTIAWKAMLRSMKSCNLFAVSSTRLRYESEKPSKNVHLFYGELDPYLPSKSWFATISLKPIIFKRESHDMYKKPAVVHEICKQLIATIN